MGLEGEEAAVRRPPPPSPLPPPPEPPSERGGLNTPLFSCHSVGGTTQYQTLPTVTQPPSHLPFVPLRTTCAPAPVQVINPMPRGPMEMDLDGASPLYAQPADPALDLDFSDLDADGLMPPVSPLAPDPCQAFGVPDPHFELVWMCRA